MLIRFAVENFMSLAARAELDLRAPAGGGGAAAAPLLTALPDGTQALGTALLVGANGAGKTAVLKALGALRALVLGGTRPGQPLQLSPCRLLPGDAPTHFTLELFHDGTLWTYSLTARRELVEAESLHATVAPGQPGGGVVFTRTRPSALIPSTTIKLGEAVAAAGPVAPVANDRERLQLMAQATRPEQPFLSEALRRGSPVVAPVGAWLRERLQLVRAEAKIVGVAARCARDPDFARFLTTLLAATGTGISEVTTAHTRVDPDYFATAEEKQQVVAALTGYADGFVQTEQGEIIAVMDGRLVDLYQIRLRILQRGHSGGDVELPLGELADGVLRLMHLGPLLYQGGPVVPPQVFFVDELDRSLHPRVSRQLLAQFAAQAAGATASAHGRAQLVATTHDAALLTAVHPSEVRLIASADAPAAAGAPGPRIGPPPQDLGSDELARRFVAGSLEIAPSRSLPN